MKRHRYLGGVPLIESRLNAKKWGTTGDLKYVADETATMAPANKELVDRWVFANNFEKELVDTNQALKPAAEVTTFLEENEILNVEVSNAYKKYAKEVLGEFTSWK